MRGTIMTLMVTAMGMNAVMPQVLRGFEAQE
jgi:hypothetical protein